VPSAAYQVFDSSYFGITSQLAFGPISSFSTYSPWQPNLSASIDSGARLVTGGGIPDNLPTGYYVSPTLLAEVDPDAHVAQEEIFGPVLTVTAYDTEDDAVSITAPAQLTLFEPPC
jgi:acyl-CoA reductase-like NAD-dependent aldehyde dehydrogenase